MPQLDVPLQRLRFGETRRRDAWWLTPLLTFIVYTSFVVYVTWALFQGANYWVEGTGYLSPLYSPELLGDSPHSLFGAFPDWWPRHIIPASPAILILIFPLAFRMTCYYYRGAYYKAFWADPINCAVGEPRTEYRGEQKLPLIVMNIHRYALYFALIFIGLLAHDVYKAMWFLDPSTGQESFGLGIGTLVLAVNVTLIGGYTLGCHSLRHLVGGFIDEISKKPLKKKAYDCVSCLNRQHPKWAWFSMLWVGWTDIYIRLLATGVISDWRLF
ncbi:MAG: succinate dehydrogenase [Deltaproteobacteria bacterium]|nr:succinate dehydrogenase [Deltaproteobacteria bacterium]